MAKRIILNKQFQKFARLSTRVINDYTYLQNCTQINFDINAYKSGLLNDLWQGWGRYWRSFWLCHMLGGVDLNGNTILGSHSGMLEFQAISQLAHWGRRSQGNYSRNITSSFYEPTWGSKKLISNIALFYRPIHSSFQNIQNGLLFFGQSIEHIQVVRNAIIHPHYDIIQQLRTNVFPHYQIVQQCDYREIIDKDEINTGTNCFQKWNEDMIALIVFR